MLAKLEDGYGVRINSTAAARFAAAQERKRAAANEARAIRLEATTAKLRRQLARMRGEPPPPTSVADINATYRKLHQLRGPRMFMQLVAEEEEEEQDGEDGVIGSVTLVLRRVEAVLPPPFPTTAPLRMYLCNMAVHTGHRRRGVAKALLQEAQRLGKRWGQDTLWLHVETHNVAALQLYLGEGFQLVRTDPWWYVMGRQHLLRKPLPPAPRRGSRQPEQLQRVGGQTGADGVFSWSLTDEATASTNSTQGG